MAFLRRPFVCALCAGLLLMLSLARVSADTYAYLSQFGTAGSGSGQLLYPNDVAIDGNGNFFVADYSHNRIVKFDHNGSYLAQFGAFGSALGMFNRREGLAVDGSGYLFVADTYNHRIQKFDNNGNFVPSSFAQDLSGQPGSGPGEFDYPIGVAVDGSGNVFIADTYNNRIQKFDNNGNYLAQFGTSGSGPGQFSYPELLTVDGNGNVFVAEYGNLYFPVTDASLRRL
jgi:DNA-binding beta-propeller fold protein YncE